MGTAATELIHISSSWSGFRNVSGPVPARVWLLHSWALNIPGANSCSAPGDGLRSPAWSGGKPFTQLPVACFLGPHWLLLGNATPWVFVSSGLAPSAAVASPYSVLPVARGPRWAVAVSREGDGAQGLRASESLGAEQQLWPLWNAPFIP